VLIKITNHCSMHCSHCMEDALETNEHMTEETFREALAFTRRIEEPAWGLGARRLILLSGGEPTEHPDIVKFIEIVIKESLIPLLITNGMWLADERLSREILRPRWRQLLVQVTNDPRYYPKKPPRVDDDRIVYIESLSQMITLGRFKEGDRTGEIMKKAPASFNLRSATRTLRDFQKAVCFQRLRAATGLSGHCTPNITHEGDVLAGESRFCWKLGTVKSTNEELTKAVFTMGSCNRCGLEAGLAQSHKRAIGLSTLYMPEEL